MDLLLISIFVFIIMESVNVAILYFWRLHPTIKKLDAMGCITLKGYSKALGWMITGFLIMFTLALIGHILTEVISA